MTHIEMVHQWPCSKSTKSGDKVDARISVSGGGGGETHSSGLPPGQSNVHHCVQGTDLEYATETKITMQDSRCTCVVEREQGSGQTFKLNEKKAA